MATADELIIKIRADMRDIERKLENLERKSGQTARTMQHGFRRAAQSINSAFRSIRGPAFGAISAGIALSVRESARAEEIRSRFNAVFRGIEDDTRAWATTTAEATARSSIALEQYLSTFQDTFVPLGLAREEAAGFSQTLTQLAIDLASFNNESEPETVQALQSAIVGNHETVRRYGVIINQAGLDQELLNMGIRGGAQQATAAQAAMARLNLIMSGTADAQGDAARTSESATNQWRSFTAELRDAAVAIGDSFMPAALQLLGWLEDAIPNIERMGVWLGDTASSIDRALGGGSLFEPITANDIREQRDRVDELFRHYDEIAARGARFGDNINIPALRQVLSNEAVERILAFNTGTEAAAQAALELDARFIELVLRLREVEIAARGATEETDDLANSLRVTEEEARRWAEFEVPQWSPDPPDIQSAEEIKAAFEALEPVGVDAFTETMEAAGQMEEALERIKDGAVKNLENAFVDFVRTGRFEIASLVDYMIEQFARLAFQNTIGNALDSVFESIFGAVLGGPAGKAAGFASGVSGKIAGAPAMQVAAAGSQARLMTVASGRAVTVSQPINIDARGADAGVEDRIRRIFADQGPALQQQTIRATIEAIGRINGAGRVQN